MRIQGLLGSDIAMQLDICPPGGSPRAELEAAVHRTTRWAERCLAARAPGQAVFGIVQGGTAVDLRLAHLEALGRLPFEGIALGGFSVGEANQSMHATSARARARAAPRAPALPDGCRNPRGPGEGDRLWRRHVRLCDADPQREERPGFRAERKSGDQKRALSGCARAAGSGVPLPGVSPGVLARVFCGTST